MKLVRDNLFAERGACPTPWLDSDRTGTVTGAGEEGRLAGRKNDGVLSTFMMENLSMRYMGRCWEFV